MGLRDKERKKIEVDGRKIRNVEIRDRSLFIAWGAGGGVGGFWAKHDEI